MYLCLDIETRLSQEAADLEKRFARPASNIKDPLKQTESVTKKCLQLDSKSALLDTAPIGCIGIADDTGCMVVHNDKNISTQSISNILCVQKESVREMLLIIRAFMDAKLTLSLEREEPLIIVGFNSLKFDIPKIRLAYIREGLYLPKALIPLYEDNVNVQHYDVMLKFIKYFTVSQNPFVSLDEVALKLNIVEEGKPIKSSEIPTLFEQGKTLDICQHCGLDVLKTAACWQKMSGMIGE